MREGVKAMAIQGDSRIGRGDYACTIKQIIFFFSISSFMFVFIENYKID